MFSEEEESFICVFKRRAFFCCLGNHYFKRNSLWFFFEEEWPSSSKNVFLCFQEGQTFFSVFVRNTSFSFEKKISFRSFHNKESFIIFCIEAQFFVRFVKWENFILFPKKQSFLLICKRRKAFVSVFSRKAFCFKRKCFLQKNIFQGQIPFFSLLKKKKEETLPFFSKEVYFIFVNFSVFKRRRLEKKEKASVFLFQMRKLSFSFGRKQAFFSRQIIRDS